MEDLPEGGNQWRSVTWHCKSVGGLELSDDEEDEDELALDVVLDDGVLFSSFRGSFSSSPEAENVRRWE
jgi:hypothetical protein